VQISNSVGAPVGFHADPANVHGPLASQIFGSRSPEAAAAKSPEGSTSSANPANPAAGQNSVPGPDSPDQQVGRPSRFMARRAAGKTNQQPDATVNGVPVTGTHQDLRPAQFLAILSDVQDTQAGVAKAQATASQVLSQLARSTLGASFAAAASTAPNPNGQVTSQDEPAPAETVAASPDGGGNRQSNSDPSNAVPPARTIDALLEAGQAAASQVVNEPKAGAASSSELAFAARIAFRAPDARVIAPNEGQAAIAASRFEAKVSTPPTVQPAAESSGEPIVVAPQFDAMTSDGGSGEPRDHAEPSASAGTASVSANSSGADQSVQAAQALGTTTQPAPPTTSQAVAVQPATGRTQGSPANSGAITAKTAAAGQVGSSPLPGSQNASSGIVAAAPASIEAPSGRSATNAKPVTQEHTAPDVVAQNDPVERAAEAVHDISLNLSNKDQNVQLRLSERGGELHVTVRTPDSTLTHGLREGLSDLVGRLERGGYRAETWQPGSDSRDRGQDSPSRRGFSQQQNGKGGGRQQNAQDSESETQTPKWIGELESSFQEG